MTRYGAIRLGDSHTGVGVMLEASGFPLTDKKHCLLGDRAFCPTHGGSFALVSGGNPDFMVVGRMAAIEPAKLACGCTVISTCREYFAKVDETGGATMSESAALGALLPAVAAFASPSASIATSTGADT